MQTPARSLMALPLLAALALGGCLGRPASVTSARPDPATVRVIAMAAEQVRRCYRTPPRLDRGARSIITRLGVAFAPDGTLAELPSLVEQNGVTDENRTSASQLAEAAALAVVRCAPLKLPAEQYLGGWNSFVLTFSYKAIA